MRHIFIGDIHGCLQELKLLIKKLHLDSADKVFLTGDLINKGPYSVETIKYVFASGFRCVMGNHDFDFFIKYKENSKYKKWINLLTTDELEWYLNLPFFIEEKNFILVHAGIDASKKLSQQDTRILTEIREFDGEKKIPWYKYYKGSKKIIYGHWAFKGLNLRKNTIGLDSGCAYGKSLSAYVLESGEIIQEKALEPYAMVNK